MATQHRVSVVRIATLALLLIGFAGQGWAQGVPADTLVLDLADDVTMEFVVIRPGEFMMGDPIGDEDERIVRRVEISGPFYLGKTEVTQAQWEAVMGANPSRFKDPNNPVENVNWYDCQTFIRRLNEKFAEQGHVFRLPTEAEWEYACRAGTDTVFSFGGNTQDLGDYAWCAANSEGTTHPVGEKPANAWGLHDMHGNVWEWCSDYYDKDYALLSPEKDPQGPTSGTTRVRRGGSYEYGPYHLRSGHRNFQDFSYRSSQLGLRVVCER